MENEKLIHDLYEIDEWLHDFLHRKESVADTSARIDDEIDAVERRLEHLRKAKNVYEELRKMGLTSREEISDFIFSCGKALLAQGDEKEALTYFEFASDFGGAKAKIGYAKTLIYKTMGVSSPEEGIDILRHLAEEDVPEAAYLLYLVHADFPSIVEGKEAKESYEKAASLGYRPALPPLPDDFDTRGYTEILLERYENGDHTVCVELYERKDLDEERRASFLKEAVDGHSPEAEEKFATLLENEGKIEEAITYYKRAGEDGRPAAYIRAAKLLKAKPHFYEGAKGDLQQEESALYSLAAEKDVPIALTWLGYAYLKGFLHERDANCGLSMLEKAVSLGEHSDAPYLLGVEYEKGEITKQNCPLAASYFEKAAGEGNIAAIFALHRIYSKGAPGVEKDSKRASRYLFMSGFGRD